LGIDPALGYGAAPSMQHGLRGLRAVLNLLFRVEISVSNFTDPVLRP